MNNSIIKKDFKQWICSLEQSSLTNTDKKLLTILLDNFDQLESCGTGGGKRANKLGKLIQQNHKITPLQVTSNNPSNDSSALIFPQKITEVSIGPFRGFTSNETFKLDKKYTFMYGPNGSGKTSFCEGLEYALLNNIEEANSKRISLEKYAKNTLVKSFSKPQLYTQEHDSEKYEIEANPSIFRFSFIERNRIDGFARITADTPTAQRAKIVTLFGLDALSKFVDGFTDNFDDKYINLNNTKEEELNSKSEEINYAKQRISEIEIEQEKLSTRAVQLLEKVNEPTVTSLKELIVNLDGKDGLSGKINEIQERKAQNIPEDLPNQSEQELTTKNQELNNTISNLKSFNQQLTALSTEVNYKDLYSALQLINESTSTNIQTCPACDTPLDAVTKNPFEKATAELSSLKELSDLQSSIRVEKTNLTKGISSVNTKIESVNTIGRKANPNFQATNLLTVIDISSDAGLLLLLEKELINLNSFISSLEIFEKLVTDFNLNLETKRKLKAATDNELIKYQEYKKTCNEIISNEKSIKKEKTKLENKVKQFNDSHEQLIKEIESQNKKIKTNQKFVDSYTKLISNLKKYRDALPSSLASGLSQLSVEFYNIINSHDQDFEKIDLLTLPTKPKQEITLKFKGSHENHNALNILSEGHIKILGLAILLSKVVEMELGFIIYDDIVNAIDDEHRDGVAELLLNHPILKDKQHIITCHGEYFINKLEQKLGASRSSKEVNAFRFIPSDMNEIRGVKVTTGDSKHYLLIAKQAYAEDDRKKVAGSCRQALEAISQTLWKKIGQKLNVNLSVKMRIPNGAPDLASVVDGLIKEVRKISNTDELSANLKLLKDKYHWFLLNKGVHEQESLPEFERKDLFELFQLVSSVEEQILSLKIEVSSSSG